MCDFDKRYKVKNMPIKFIPLILFVIVIMLSIGYSSMSDSLSVTGMVAYIRKQEDIRVTGFKYISNAVEATSSNANYATKSVFADIDLPSANSTVTYEVEVTNIGNVEECINSVTLSSNNLTYTFDGYELKRTLCDANNNLNCTSGSVSKFRITIGYKENGYDSNNTNYSFNALFDFAEAVNVARIGQTYYQTLQEAINAAPTNKTETTVVLLKNIKERVKIWAGNNIVLDMQGLVMRNKNYITGTGDPVVEIFGDKAYNPENPNNPSTVGAIGGTFKMINGTISTAASQSAINVENAGTFKMTGGSIIANGDRQALYIKNGGTAEISGTAYLQAKALVENENYRATVQAIAGGNLLITGGTIESIGGAGIAVTNEGTTTFGIKDGNVSTTSPLIKGTDCGLRINTGSTTKLYDGVFKGRTSAIYNETEIVDKETGYGIKHSSEIINNDTYYVAFLANGLIVRFDPGEGTTSEATRIVIKDHAVGPLPTASRSGFSFDGWYTEENALVQPTDLIDSEVTFSAHWTPLSIDNSVAQIGNQLYNTLAEAVSNVSASEIIYLLKDTSEYITISAGMNVVLDLQSHTLSLPSDAASNIPVIDNSGTTTVMNGNITTYSTKTAAINNNAGARFIINSGSIASTGQRQAIYNNGGTVEIGGTAYLQAKATVDSNKRGTVHNVTVNSVLKITGGTIVSTASNGIGVSNLGTATIGTKDGNISTTSPVIQGIGTGIYNASSATVNIYDGILKAKTTPLNNLNSNGLVIEDNSEPAPEGTETIDGQSYKTWYLQSIN